MEFSIATDCTAISIIQLYFVSVFVPSILEVKHLRSDLDRPQFSQLFNHNNIAAEMLAYLLTMCSINRFVKFQAHTNEYLNSIIQLVLFQTTITNMSPAGNHGMAAGPFGKRVW